MLEWLQTSVEAAGPMAQAFFLMLGGAIPFIESYGSSFLGVVAGVPLYITVPFAVLGNIVSMLVLVLGAEELHNLFRKNKPAAEPSKRKQKFYRLFEKYGVAGVSLIGQWFLPSQITSSMMAGAGVAKGKIIFWQVIAIVLWGVVFAGFATAGINIMGVA